MWFHLSSFQFADHYLKTFNFIALVIFLDMVPGDSPGHLAAGRPRQAHRQERQEVRAGAGADQGG